jgi:hypothetical protein
MAEAAAGILLALATMVKVFPGLLLPYPAITTKRLRLTAWSAVGLIICLAVGVALGGGVDNTLEYFGSFLPSLYGQRLHMVYLDDQSISAFFMRLFVPSTTSVALLGAENLRTVEFSPLVRSRTLALAMTYASSALVLALTAIAVLRVAGGRLNKTRWAAGFALVLVVPLLVISSAGYHLHALLLLPLAVVVRAGIKLHRPGVLTAALVVYLFAAVHRYANWLAAFTSSAWFVAFGLYATCLLWGTLLFLTLSVRTGDAAGCERGGG